MKIERPPFPCEQFQGSLRALFPCAHISGYGLAEQGAHPAEPLLTAERFVIGQRYHAASLSSSRSTFVPLWVQGAPDETLMDSFREWICGLESYSGLRIIAGSFELIQPLQKGASLVRKSVADGLCSPSLNSALFQAQQPPVSSSADTPQNFILCPNFDTVDYFVTLG